MPSRRYLTGHSLQTAADAQPKPPSLCLEDPKLSTLRPTSVR
jgi:hypothetical protein